MKRIAAFVVEHARLAWALALFAVLGTGLLAGQLAGQVKESERLSLLTTEAERRGIEIMSQTLNGNLMGSVTLLGLIDENIKREARGEVKPNGPQMAATLESVGRALDADGVFIVDAGGIAQSSWDNSGKPSTGLNLKFRPYFQMAQQGLNNVYAAVSIARGDRSLYFAAPIYADRGNGSDSIGAVVARTSLVKLDNLLKDKADIAVLLSPQGVVFASNRPEWVGHLDGVPTPERLKAIRELKQFGNMFENKAPALLPVATADGLQTLDGRRYAVASARVQWNDPFGDWRLVLLEDLARTVPRAQLAWVGIATGGGALLVGLLLLGMLRSNHIQAEAARQIETYAQAQEAAAERKTRLAAISLRLQQTRGVAALGQAFLSEAHALLGSLQGTVYLCEDAAAPGLRLAASFGCATAPQEELAPGEGLLGQCALERRMLTVAAPHENYWRIRSGLGSAVPVAALMVPILLNEALLGVAEIALIKPPDDDARELFEEMSKLLALNVEIQRRVEHTEKMLTVKEAAEREMNRLADVERFNRLAQGREIRILELKHEVNALARAAGQAEPYATTLVETVGDHDLASHPDYRTDQPEASADLQLRDLVDLDELQKLFTAFCESVGIAAAIIDLAGQVMVSARWQPACTDFHRVNPESCKRCIESDTELASQLDEGAGFTIYKCKNGMTDAAAPIVVEGRHLANVFIGQFHLGPPDMDFFAQQARQFGYPEDAYLRAIAAAPVMDEKRLPDILGFLSGFARFISTLSLARQRAAAAQQQLEDQAELLRKERLAAMSLAEDNVQARMALEQGSPS